MKITLNGEEREFDQSLSVKALLEAIDVVPERVVVEVNLTILKRAQHPDVQLNDGDRVEIVQFVGGG